MVRLSFGSSFLISIILGFLRIMCVEMLLPGYTWLLIPVGIIYFLIPRFRRLWWMPPVGFFIAFLITYWIGGILNSLEPLYVSFWFGSAGVCMIYGYLIASVLLLLNKLADWAVKMLQGE